MTMTVLKSTAAVAILAAALASCAKPAPPPDPAKAAEAVKADVKQMVAEFNAKDVDKAISHDAADMVGIFHGAPNIMGPEQDRALTKEQVANLVSLVVSDETVDVAKSADMAVYRATYAYTVNDPKTGKPVTEHGNWILHYKKEGDAWKIATNVVSDTPAPASNAPAPAAK
jgi:ketosteroid isomerase-like protein